jgi:hypothetical protein
MPGDNIPESMGEDFSESVGEDISEQAGAIISESVGGFPRNQHLAIAPRPSRPGCDLSKFLNSCNKSKLC